MVLNAEAKNHRVGQAGKDLRRSFSPNSCSEQVLSLELISLDFFQSDPENLLKIFQSLSGQLVRKLHNKTMFILVLARIPLPHSLIFRKPLSPISTVCSSVSVSPPQEPPLLRRLLLGLLTTFLLQAVTAFAEILFLFFNLHKSTKDGS